MNVDALRLDSVRIGPLPIVNHFIEHLGIDRLLERFVPTTDRRVRLPYAKALGVLLRSVLVEREPIYGQQETVASFSADGFGLEHSELEHLGDDRIGRALDRLFDADRGTLLTELAVHTVRKCGLSLERLHTDATSVSFAGRYDRADGRSVRGRRAPKITFGYSKDHRTDLKQLLLEFSITADGAVPLRFRCVDGNVNEDGLHIETWETLCRIARRRDFLYVADSKLCSRSNMNYIDRRGGRFVTVMPKGRLEYREFAQWIQSHRPEWREVSARPRRRGGEAVLDTWAVFRSPMPSSEGWPITWVHNSTLADGQRRYRRTQISLAVRELDRIDRMLHGNRRRPRTLHDLNKRVERVLSQYGVARYVVPSSSLEYEHTFLQERGGHTKSWMKYRRVPTEKLVLTWIIDDEAIRSDALMDGIYPLICNDPSLTPEQVLAAHKGQPHIEKRFQQAKGVFEIAPVFLKSEARIEAFFTLFFIAMVVQAVIERRLRRAMAASNTASLPLYPEQRSCRQPTSDQVLRLFAHVQRHHLRDRSSTVRTFEAEFTPLQSTVLDLLGVSRSAFVCQ